MTTVSNKRKIPSSSSGVVKSSVNPAKKSKISGPSKKLQVEAEYESSSSESEESMAEEEEEEEEDQPQEEAEVHLDLLYFFCS
jgi:hypothetical protein